MTSDKISPYIQVPPSRDVKKLTSSNVGGKKFMVELGFYGLCRLPCFLIAS